MKRPNELKDALDKLQEARSTLRVIHTWAVFDTENYPKYPRTLEPKDVIKLCTETLDKIGRA
jgi:hypothetical protein